MKGHGTCGRRSGPRPSAGQPRRRVAGRRRRSGRRRWAWTTTRSMIPPTGHARAGGPLPARGPGSPRLGPHARRTAPDQGHQGPRVEGGRPGDGFQADRVRAAPLADGQRTPPGRARPRRIGLHQRQTRRAVTGTRRTGGRRSRLKDLNPQVLTITPADRQSCLDPSVARRGSSRL